MLLLLLLNRIPSPQRVLQFCSFDTFWSFATIDENAEVVILLARHTRILQLGITALQVRYSLGYTVHSESAHGDATFCIELLDSGGGTLGEDQ